MLYNNTSLASTRRPNARLSATASTGSEQTLHSNRIRLSEGLAAFAGRLLLSTLLLLLPLVASATTFPVTTTADSGTGSLREAIDLANANAGADDITFSTTGTLTLATALPTITEALTITGSPGFAIASTVTVFQITGGASNVTIQDMDLSAATVTTNTSGGTIRILGGSSTVLIENNNFANTSGTAIDINNGADVTINDNDFTGRRRVLFTIPVDGLTVTNNDMTNTGHTGLSAFQLNLTTNLLMHSNNFMGVEYIFVLQNFTDLNISDVQGAGTNNIVLTTADNYSAVDKAFFISPPPSGAADVSISNLSFAAGSGNVVEAERGEGVHVNNVSIDGRSVAVLFRGSLTNSSVECSSFTNISTAAIKVDGTVSNLTIQNNSFACITGDVIDNNTATAITAENNFYGYDADPVAGDFGGTVDFDPFLSDADACAPDGAANCAELVEPPTPATALDFNGTNDLLISDGTMPIFGSTPTTVEFWVKRNANDGAFKAPLGLTSNPGSQDFYFDMVSRFGPTAFVHENSSIYNLETAVPADTWTHLAITFDPGTNTIRGYVNGQPAANPSQANFTAPAINAHLILGNRQNNLPAINWDGAIDEVRIWSQLRSDQEIADNFDTELAIMPPCLLLYYKMNQGFVDADNTGETTADDTATNLINNGTLSNFTLTGSTSNWTEGSGITAVNSVYDPFSEIAITGSGQSISDGDNSATSTDGTDFGTVVVGQTASTTFTIENSGTGDLDLTAYSSDEAQFTFTAGAPTVVTPGQTADFTVIFTPTSETTVDGIITIANNDCDEGPYNYAVKGTGMTALPVEYLSLSATGKKDHILLEWATENEEENLGFYIERRAETESDFQEMGFVAAATTTASNYTFNDHQVLPANNYIYRLRQTDFDGAIAYSPLVLARTQDAKEGVTAWPNPTNGLLFVQATSSITQATLHDATSRTVRTFSLVEGFGKADLSNLSTGVYFLRVGDVVRRVVR